MAEEEGASPRELLLEASRRNNHSLLKSVLSSLSPTDATELINSATDALGQSALHLAALHGSYEVLDTLLDQEGVEVDPVDRIERETPLHKAVRYVNDDPDEGLDGGEDGVGTGVAIVEMLLDAGASVMGTNKDGRTARQLCSDQSGKIADMLRKSELEHYQGQEDVVDPKDDEGPTGSASDSE